MNFNNNNQLNVDSLIKAEVDRLTTKYNKDFLDKNMYMCMSLAIAFYALWAKDYENIIVLWTVPVVMIMAMKYSYNIETKGSEGDPTDIIIKDKALISLGIIYIILMLFGIYL